MFQVFSQKFSYSVFRCFYLYLYFVKLFPRLLAEKELGISATVFLNLYISPGIDSGVLVNISNGVLNGRSLQSFLPVLSHRSFPGMPPKVSGGIYTGFVVNASMRLSWKLSNSSLGREILAIVLCRTPGRTIERRQRDLQKKLCHKFWNLYEKSQQQLPEKFRGKLWTSKESFWYNIMLGGNLW